MALQHWPAVETPNHERPIVVGSRLDHLVLHFYYSRPSFSYSFHRNITATLDWQNYSWYSTFCCCLQRLQQLLVNLFQQAASWIIEHASISQLRFLRLRFLQLETELLLFFGSREKMRLLQKVHTPSWSKSFPNMHRRLYKVQFSTSPVFSNILLSYLEGALKLQFCQLLWVPYLINVTALVQASPFP